MKKMAENELKVVVRGCHNLVPYRKLVTDRQHRWPRGVEAGLLPCSSKVEAHQVLKFFEQGADGALILACPLGACRLVEGNRRAAKRVGYAAEWLDEIGLEPVRVRFVAVEPDRAGDLTELISEFYQEIVDLGPTPIRGSGPGGGES